MQTQETDLVELGTVSVETRGMWHVGPEDVSTGARIFIVGISADD